MNHFSNQTYYTIFIPVIIVGFFVVYGGLVYLWNRKWLPRQRARGAVIMPLGMIIKNATKIAMREDTLKFLPKVDNKLTNKFLTLKALNWGLLIFTFALLFAKNGNFWLPFVFLILSIWIRTTKILNQRKQILIRMFAVASSVFRYGKGSDLQPWNYVKIKKWESFTVPGETHANIPATWDASSPTSRDGFERHFNTTVTNDNSWIYEWKSADGIVICQPITHLPQRAAYPDDGSKKYEWYEIPLGLGASGEVTVDLTKTPHMLICGTTGSGKSLALSTPVLTANRGWITIADLKVGDYVFGVNGLKTQVTHLHPIVTPLKAYKVTFKSGETLTVDADHLWETLTKKDAYELFQEKNPNTTDFWLSPEVVTSLIGEYEASSTTDTISISEAKELTGLTSSSALYRIAKQVGVAELVNKTIHVHYKNPEVTQKQKLTTVTTREFLDLYNSRPIVSTAKYPLTSFMFEKLTEYAQEVRDDDNVSIDNVLAYTGPHSKRSSKILVGLFDFNQKPKKMFAKALEAAQELTNPFPTKIFSLGEKDLEDSVSFYDLVNLAPLASHSEVKQFFYHMTRNAVTRSVNLVDQQRIFPTGDHQIRTAPIEYFPKKLFIKATLERAGVTVGTHTVEGYSTQIRSTEEIISTLVSKNYLYKGDTLSASNHYIRSAPALDTPDADLLVAPYTLGAYLGDGYSSRGKICGEDDEIFEFIEQDGYEVQNITHRLGYANDFREVTFKGLLDQLRLLKVAHPYGNTNKFFGEVKHIPEQYLLASETQRRALLRGLLDTDGSIKADGRIVFSNTNRDIVDSVISLVASLGYIPSIELGSQNKVENAHWKDMFHATFVADPKDKLFGLTRKNIVHAERYKNNVKNHLSQLHKIVSIEEVETVPMRCISVNSEDRLFLVGRSLIPTHNSVLQRNLIFHCIQHNDMWRFLGVDVKRVELTPFKKYTQTVLGIGPNLEDGVEIVRYAKKVMETRYEKMEEAGVNHFKDLIDPATGKPHYAIMLMVDEAFMFMSPEGAKTDEGKARDQLHGEASTMLGEIARLGRASGVHLVLATQRPDATVIKGELKANLDIRIAAGRLDSTPSMMVLDSGAATMLPGDIKGRGIVRFGGEQEQFQGYFAEQDWIDQWLEKHPGVEPELYPVKDGSYSEEGVLDELTQLSEGLDFEDGIIAPLEETTEDETTSSFQTNNTPLPTIPNFPTTSASNDSQALPDTAALPDPIKNANVDEEIDEDALSFIDSFLAQDDDKDANVQTPLPSSPVLPATPAKPSNELPNLMGKESLPGKVGLPSLPPLPNKSNTNRPALPPLPPRK